MDLADLRRRYNDKENEELLYVLSNPSEYNSNVIEIVEEIIKNRGGREKIVEEINTEINKENERRRLITIIRSKLNIGRKEKEIKEEIKSEIFSNEECSNLIDEEFARWTEEQLDQKITPKSIIGGIIGALIGGTIGGILWGFMMIGSGNIFFIFGIGLVLLSYFFVRLFSRKSNKNIFTMILTFLSVVYALVLGQLIFELYG